MKTIISMFMVLLVIVNMSARSNAQITITFKVNAAGINVAEMHLAGTFASNNSSTILADWDPGTITGKMEPISGSAYLLEVTFPDSSSGNQLQFLFVRNNVWTQDGVDFSEGNPGETHLNSSCGIDDGGGGFNRVITIPEVNAEYIADWDYCGTLSVMQCLAPTQPGSVAASDEAKLNWAGAAYADKYRVRYHAEGSNNWKIKNFPGNISVATLSNLLPETVYEWSVSALCGNSHSDWSPLQYFTTHSLRIGETTDEKENLQLFPNPTNGKFSIVFSADAGNKSSLLVTDITGRVVIHEEFGVLDYSFEKEYDISNEQAGAYILRLEKGGHTSMRKLYLFK